MCQLNRHSCRSAFCTWISLEKSLRAAVYLTKLFYISIKHANTKAYHTNWAVSNLIMRHVDMSLHSGQAFLCDGPHHNRVIVFIPALLFGCMSAVGLS